MGHYPYSHYQIYVIKHSSFFTSHFILPLVLHQYAGCLLMILDLSCVQTPFLKHLSPLFQSPSCSLLGYGISDGHQLRNRFAVMFTY